MINNYCLLGRGQKPWLKNDVGDFRGSPPQNHKLTSWQRHLSVLVLLAAMLFAPGVIAQIALPYTENFTSITAANGLPTVTGGAWSRSNATAAIQPTYIANQTTYNRSGNGDTKFIAFRWDAGTNYWFVGPFSLTGGTSYTASVLYKADGLAGFGPLSLTYGSAATDVGQATTIVSVPANINNAAYQPLTGAFTPAATGSYYLAIRNVSNGSPWYLSLDDFKLNVTPNCPAPAGITVSNFTGTAFDFSWSPLANTPVNYEYAVTTSSTPPVSGTSTTATSVTGYTPVSGSTTYYVHVRANCGSEYSTWSTTPYTTSFIAPVPYVQEQ